VEQRSLLTIVGINLASVVLMALVLAIRIRSVDAWIPIHFNAEGSPDLWGSNATLWRIPLMAGICTVMACLLAWFMLKRDAFAARFSLLSALLIQALGWVGMLRLLW
jgi:hypothetical protein